MAQARTLALSGGKSPKCLGGNLGDFGEFCKGLKILLFRQVKRRPSEKRILKFFRRPSFLLTFNISR
ncbi:hypothetical protein DPV97_03470 [Haemophilus parainfluenzae]|uniref:Uncharacterized protein n=1 Tax=Haemophilus parainfluenzae TaxID=729 RepID=A0AB37INT1_HAEPA|nr:hypothetical protein DPV97_03470 [Haemophilus parainfluenzae]RDF07200.1 hypothetical protein DPV91_03520 [Haemophilus parainfluenzae]